MSTLQPLRTIAVIACDQGLLSSLVFSLEVAGYRVLASEGWPEGGLAGRDLACAVVDAGAYGRDCALREGLATLDVPLVYLADGLIPLPAHSRLSPLTKPVQGPDLLQLVERHLADAAAPEPAPASVAG